MKAVLVAGVALISAALAYAGPVDVPRPGLDMQLAEEQLLNDIHCNNCQTRDDAIYDLGELRCEKAVIPLMAVLHSNGDETARIMAALALCRIGEARGTFAVKRAAMFDGSQKVRTLAAWFYNTYVKEGTFLFQPAARDIASRN
jgi:HEAT repeat protein